MRRLNQPTLRRKWFLCNLNCNASDFKSSPMRIVNHRLCLSNLFVNTLGCFKIQGIVHKVKEGDCDILSVQLCDLISPEPCGQLLKKAYSTMLDEATNVEKKVTLILGTPSSKNYFSVVLIEN